MDALLRIMAKAKEYADDIENYDYKGLAETYENATLAEINLLLSAPPTQPNPHKEQQ
jgi:hypothetical protein